METRKRTKDRLAEALERANAPQEMIKRARDGYYDDYLSPLVTPIVRLVQDARQHKLKDIAERAIRGEFDAEDWEADEWARSPEGQATLKEFGHILPYSDAEDMSRGLRFIPGEVTLARREGQRVPFIQSCSHQCCWYWQFPDGSRTYYWESWDYEAIAKHNGKTKNAEGNYPDGIGACPNCGNPHTRGGHVKKEETAP